MSTLDFVQIRWQQIRLTEAAQLIESENIALKKELKELREKASATPVVVADPNAGASKSIVNKSCANMTNILMRLQSELVKLKLTSVQEIAGLVNHKSLLEKAFDKFALKYRVKEAEYEALEFSRDQLQERLDEANQEIESGKTGHSQELDKVRLKYKQTRAELKESQQGNERLTEKYQSLEEKYNLLVSTKQEIEANYHELGKEYQTAKTAVEKVRAEGEAALADSFSNKLAMQEQYEKIVEELSFENEYLRKTCAEQEEQIARLTSTLIGNKSHFARYVEVKTENLTLQSKLNEVVKGGGKRLAGAEGSGVLGSTGSGRHSATSGNGVAAVADYSGLPAHQRRNKSVLSSAGAASLAGSSNSSSTSSSWGYAAAGSGLSRASPQTSPRGATIGSIGKATSSSSVLAEPCILPPPVTMPRPTEGLPPTHTGGRSQAPGEDGSFGEFASRNAGNSSKGTKKSLRFEPPSVNGGPVGSGTANGSGSGKAVQSNSHSSSSNKQQGGWERQVI